MVLDLDVYIAAQTASTQSYHHPAERVMSTLNLGLQNVALARQSMEPAKGIRIKSLGTLKKIWEASKRDASLIKPISNYFENIYSKFQCGFRQGLSAQHCLVSMIEKEKKSVDKGKTFTVLFTDVSEAFYCLLHDLIIAKLCVYGFNLSAARLMQSYLSNTGFDLSF